MSRDEGVTSASTNPHLTGLFAPVHDELDVGDLQFNDGPTIVTAILAGEVGMVINTPYGNSGPRVDGYEIRSAAVMAGIPCITTVQGASAAVQGIKALIREDIGVRPLQELHRALRASR